MTSLARAKELYADGWLSSLVPGTAAALLDIHNALFSGIYDFAGKVREADISKGGFLFARYMFLDDSLNAVEKMPHSDFMEIADKYIEMNVVHPFMDGNGRATRIWLDLLLMRQIGMIVDWTLIGKEEYLCAMRKSHSDAEDIRRLLQNALTPDISNLELVFRGLAQSWYYEGLELPKT